MAEERKTLTDAAGEVIYAVSSYVHDGEGSVRFRSNLEYLTSVSEPGFVNEALDTFEWLIQLQSKVRVESSPFIDERMTVADVKAVRHKFVAVHAGGLSQTSRDHSDLEDTIITEFKEDSP